MRAKAKKPPKPTKEEQQAAKAEAEILIHEKLQALLDSDEKRVETIGCMIDVTYRCATEEGKIIPTWRES